MSIVVSPTAHANETWKSTTKSIQQPDVFQQCCLRKIMNIKWQDGVTNKEILRRAEITALSELIVDKLINVLHGEIVKYKISQKVLKWIPDGWEMTKRTTKENLAFNYQRRFL